MTFNQKFILLLSADKFFQDECLAIRDLWNLPKNEMIASVTSEQLLPIEYKKDIRFILNESEFPGRFLWPLHCFILSNNIPKLKDLPSSIRIYPSLLEEYDMGKIYLEIDLDATKEELAKSFKDIYMWRKIMLNGIRVKKFQPIRNFDSVLKNAKQKIKRAVFNIDQLLEFENDKGKTNYSEIEKFIRKHKNAWRVARYRIKSISYKREGGRVSVKDREKFEEWSKSLPEPEF